MSKQKTTLVKIKFPATPSFPVVACFNVFSVERLDVGVLVHGGLKSTAGTHDAFSIIIDGPTLAAAKLNWGEYLTKIGDPNPGFKASEYQPTARIGLVPVPLANMVLWNRRDDVCEIRCFAMSVGELTEAAKKGGEIGVQPIALLQSSKNVQSCLLAEILKEAL